MPDTDFKRWSGTKSLMQFLASAIGEQHDAAVYDTGYEFDPHSKAALLFLAGIAMTKANKCVEARIRTTPEVFDAPMPQDGSVVPIGTEPERENMRISALYRERREREAKYTYIPDSEKYSEAVVWALVDCDIPYEDLTPEELKDKEEKREQARHKQDWDTFYYEHLPKLLLVLLCLVGLCVLANAL